MTDGLFVCTLPKTRDLWLWIALPPAVAEEAKRFGVVVQDSDLSWRESNEQSHSFVLDLYVEPCDVQSRFAFWDAVVDRTSQFIEDLTIRVHVKPKEESHD